jgi:hypothetical protein
MKTKNQAFLSKIQRKTEINILVKAVILEEPCGRESDLLC